MYFHIQLIDNPGTPEKRQETREDHWQYFDENAEYFVARGATLSDDGNQILSSVLFVEFDDWPHVRKFVDNEPHKKNGVYKEVHIRRWGFGLKRLQRDFPRKEGQVNWYIRGYGKPGAHEERRDRLERQEREGVHGIVAMTIEVHVATDVRVTHVAVVMVPQTEEHHPESEDEDRRP